MRTCVHTIDAYMRTYIARLIIYQNGISCGKNMYVEYSCCQADPSCFLRELTMLAEAI